MGGADIIPGVSGGTIALITGIYEELIFAIKSIDFKFVIYFLKGFFKKEYFNMAKKNFLSIRFKFLIPIALGIALAFLLLANILGDMLEYFPAYTYAFFFGLILSSAILVYFSSLNKISLSAIIFVILGILFGLIIVGLGGINSQNSIIIIFVAGLITFCAMILPGISGAFILYILGQYTFLLNILRDMTKLDFSNISFAISYILGGIFGLLIFSRVLSFLLKKYRTATLSFIIGLMIGALRKPGEFIINEPANLLITILASLSGILAVSLVGYYEFKLKSKA